MCKLLVGGICYYGANSGLYGELMQFIPRALVFIAIFFFYARLYVFLKRPDKIRASFSPSPGGTAGGGGTWQTDSSGSMQSIDGGGNEAGTRDGETDGTRGRLRRLRRRSRASSRERIREGFRSFSFKPKVLQRNDEKRTRDAESTGIKLGNLQADERAVQGKDFGQEKRPMEQIGNTGGVTSANVRNVGEIPPWERLELPPFEVDGQRYGGSGSSVLAPAAPSGFWGDFKMGRKRATSSAHSNRTDVTINPQRISREVNNNTGIRSRESSVGTVIPPRGSSGTPFLPPVVFEESLPTTQITEPSPISPECATFTAENLRSSSVFDKPRRHPGDLKMPYITQEVDPKDSSEEYRVPLAPSIPPSETTLTPSTSSSMQVLLPAMRRGSADPFAHNGIRKDSCNASSDNGSRRGSGPVSFVLPTYPRKESVMSNVEGPESMHTTRESVSASETVRDSSARGGSSEEENEEEEEEEDDGEMDFGQFLRQEGGDDDDYGRDRRQASEDSMLQQESTASYLNRKTAMLMLYFPLA